MGYPRFKAERKKKVRIKDDNLGISSKEVVLDGKYGNRTSPYFQMDKKSERTLSAQKKPVKK